MSKNYTNITVTSLPEREVEIIGEITAEKMSLMREKALKKFKESVEIDGFRKGNAPDAMVAVRVGEIKLMEESAEMALTEEYPNILEEHNIQAIGRPDISITKLAPGNPLEFKIKTSIMPEVKLTDYKKIASESNAKNTTVPEANDSEVEDVIKNIRENIAHQKMHAGDNPDEPHNHDHGPIKEEDLPPLDDELAKMLGFENLPDMKEKIKENISKEKELKEKDKRRVAILENIMKDSTIELPKIIIQGELEKMMAQFKDDISKTGVSFEEYLKHIKKIDSSAEALAKAEDDLRGEWRETAIKRAKSQVILNEIAKAEGIEAPEEDVKKEMEHILSHYKDADRFRVRMYVETFLMNELVFKFLEEQK